MSIRQSLRSIHHNNHLLLFSSPIMDVVGLLQALTPNLPRLDQRKQIPEAEDTPLELGRGDASGQGLMQAFPRTIAGNVWRAC